MHMNITEQSKQQQQTVVPQYLMYMNITEQSEQQQ